MPAPASSDRAIRRAAGPRFVGRRVVDDRGASIGTVEGVVADRSDHDADSDGAWLVVETRWRRIRRYVPAAGAYPAGDGELVVPFDRSWVRSAPRAGTADLPLTYELRRRLATHYGDTYDWWPRQRVAGAFLRPA